MPTKTYDTINAIARSWPPRQTAIKTSYGNQMSAGGARFRREELGRNRLTGINAHRARHVRASPLAYDLKDDRLLVDRLAQQLSAGEGSEAIATHCVRCPGRATGAAIWRAWTTSLQKRFVATDHCDEQ